MEEYGLFIHGTASGVASVAAWEALRCVFAGPSLIFIGMVASTAVIHQLRRMHIKHRSQMERLQGPLV